MKVLVIGGCGFIGSHVVDNLLKSGHTVRVLDRMPERFRGALPQVEYVMGDLSDSAQTYEAINGMDGVIHLASATVPATSNLDPEADIRKNLIATVRLLEAMRMAGVRQLIYLSSGGTVYGVPRTDPVAEQHPLNPISSYGIVKVAIEKYLYMEHRMHGLRHVILRASNPYGPRQGHTGVQGIIGTYLWRLSRGETIEVWGDGSVVRDFIHVRDMAALCVKALESDTCGCFNAGSGEGASVLDIVRCISQAVGRDIQPVFKPGRAFDVPRVVLDISKARQNFNWAPQIALRDGVADAWNWVQAQQLVTA
ncbi:NAD-dependent epimerase/dehydratase family protein [Paracoccus sp. SY]|uniref:NAD-dependent epimerase/dehydratase family protein n=1 Tax=Paracoccus sp. SY TaxID=1330255 RepID=UPI000CD007C3|nr:NAD-dependent epimerase/dehydratase family protein [Paracoccus sp. SY]